MDSASDNAVFCSRFTEGLKNGEHVYFTQGEHVKYMLSDGTVEEIVIASDRMKHETGCLGYESIFPDGERWFALAAQIVDWEGRK